MGRKFKLPNRIYKIKCNECKKIFISKGSRAVTCSHCKDINGLYNPILKENIDYVICKICNIRKQQLSMHLARIHGLTTFEYKEKFPGSLTLCKNVRDKLSKNNPMKNLECIKKKKDWWLNPNNKEKIKQRNTKLSISKTGVPRPDLMGDLNPSKRPEVKTQISISKKDWWTNPDNSEKIKNIARNSNKPFNNQERKINDLLSKYYPNSFMYTGSSKLILLDGCRPDFQHLYLPLIIEHFGGHWHKPEEKPQRIKRFREQGYETIVIWDYELNKKNGEEYLKTEIDFYINKLEGF